MANGREKLNPKNQDTLIIISPNQMSSTYVCGLCDRPFSKMSAYMKHRRSAHPIIDHVVDGRSRGQIQAFEQKYEGYKLGQHTIYKVIVLTD